MKSKGQLREEEEEKGERKEEKGEMTKEGEYLVVKNE